MKILYVIPFFTPKYGGPFTSTYQLSKKISESGHEVTILTTDLDYDKSYTEDLKGVRIIPSRCIFNICLFLYSPDLKNWLYQNLSKFDVVHMQDFRSYQNALVFDYAKKFGIPFILQAHGSVLPFYERFFLKQCFDYVWGNKILQNSDKVIALTEEEVSQYIDMKVPEKKISIIPNGIDHTIYNNLPEKGLFKEKYNIPKENRVILFLGRIHKIKGLDLLLEAFSYLRRVVDDITVAIVGPDEGYQDTLFGRTIELNISDRVIFTGPLYNDEKISAYIDADVYVLPSEYESFSNTVLEAWACGIPVVISDSCALAQKVAREKAGIIVRRDPIELMYAINQILENENLRRTVCARGRTLVEGEYSIESVVEKIEKLYQSVTNTEKGVNE